ncbi:ankyrin [Neocallimastix lanati (nom. inval.)]|nr:ankyrin [Neocallimastix sp. JGI-2020a]
MFRRNNVNEFNLISCYQKQEMKLNSLYINYFSLLMKTINQNSSSDFHDSEYYDNLLNSLIKKDNTKLMKYLNNKGLYFTIPNKYKLKLFRIFSNKDLINYHNDNHKVDGFMNIIKKIIKENNLNLLKILIKYNILNENNINWTDKIGDTFLSYAIKYGNQEIIQILIDNGADLQSNNKRIIECLKDYYNYDILKLLVANNFNINQINENGVLLLNYFIKDRNDKSNQIAKGLIDCGANVNYQENIQEDSLTCAIRTRNIKMIKYLIENGANINYITYYNYINMYYNYNTFCNEFYYEIYDIINSYKY